MITQILLFGALGKKYGHEWRLDVASPAEAFHAIDCMAKGFFDTIREMEVEVQGYHVKVGEKDIGEELLCFPNCGETIMVTPLLHGADIKGIIEIVAGVALIVAGAFTYGTSAFWGIQLAGLGLAIALGGVSRLLAPSPASTGKTSKPSYVFGGPTNTVSQGECVPVPYGDVIIGSAVVSAGMESQDIQVGSTTSSTDSSDQGTGGGGLPIAKHPS